MYNKYSEQMKEETAIYILESGKSITIASKELEINVNTACRWINKYKKSMELLVTKTSQHHLMKCRIKSKI